LKMKAGMRPGFTVHGLRSSFRDWATAHGASFDLREHALDHKIGSTTSRSYQREDWLEARRPVMAAWSDFVAARA
jgi:integrase